MVPFFTDFHNFYTLPIYPAILLKLTKSKNIFVDSLRFYDKQLCHSQIRAILFPFLCSKSPFICLDILHVEEKAFSPSLPCITLATNICRCPLSGKRKSLLFLVCKNFYHEVWRILSNAYSPLKQMNICFFLVYY